MIVCRSPAEVRPDSDCGGRVCRTAGGERPLRGVVELAAAGRSNRQIANALFVTVKAVEWHLGNAYRKLDVRGRAELPDVLAIPGVSP
jgi:hypothetical protein